MNGRTRAIWSALGLVAFGTGAAGPTRDRASVSSSSPAVPVRYAEGTVHGFLELSTQAGAVLAHGDLLQTVTRDGIASRMVFHMPSGSVFEETVTFTEQGTFALQTYHLVQSGPAFEDDLDATFSRSGAYTVKSRSHKDGHDHEYNGKLDLPEDTYNGMVGTVAKNISTREKTTLHIVAFMPEPRVIELELAPTGTHMVNLGKHEEKAVEFTIKPKLGFVTRMGAKITGKLPADTHLWMITDDVPAFVRSEGPMYSGPVWRLALTSPRWPE